MRHVPRLDDPRIIAGNEGFEDAAVFAATPELAVVQTVDFFAPVVDDPADFARIAAANALSDIYAMGAKPAFALALVAWPKELPSAALARVLEAGATKAAEAGCAILGGHSVVDPEPKYGLAVTGLIAPGEIWRNGGAKVGDVLLLTKPIGSGIVAAAIKQELADDATRDEAIRWMTRLNADAADAARLAGPSAVTDVTGYGLVGHAHEMALASGLGIDLDSAAVALLPGVRVLAERGVAPGGSTRNRAAADAYTTFVSLDPVTELLVCDAQTSGGLLVALPADRAGVFCEAAAACALPVSQVGCCVEGPAGTITVS